MNSMELLTLLPTQDEIHDVEADHDSVFDVRNATKLHFWVWI